jgi:hypothetical protein
VCIRHSHAVANPVSSSFEVSTSLCFHSVVGMPVAPRFRTEFDLKYRIAVKKLPRSGLLEQLVRQHYARDFELFGYK